MQYIIFMVQYNTEKVYYIFYTGELLYMVEKIVFIFFTLAYYLVLFRVINYIIPGFLALSSINVISGIVLLVLILPSLFFARKTVKYLMD